MLGAVSLNCMSVIIWTNSRKVALLIYDTTISSKDCDPSIWVEFGGHFFTTFEAWNFFGVVVAEAISVTKMWLVTKTNKTCQGKWVSLSGTLSLSFFTFEKIPFGGKLSVASIKPWVWSKYESFKENKMMTFSLPTKNLRKCWYNLAAQYFFSY